MQMKKSLILFFLCLLLTNAYAGKPKKKKPFNGNYFFTEYNYDHYQNGMMTFGLGTFRTQCKGYEMSIKVRPIRTEFYPSPPPFKIGFEFNKFHRKLIGKKYSSIGYRLGLRYAQERLRRGTITYSSKEEDITLVNAFYVSNAYFINTEVFWNKRLFGRLYFELNFRAKNGIENVQFSDSEIFEKRITIQSGPIWYHDGPGTYLRSNFIMNARLLFCFGKAKK